MKLILGAGKYEREEGAIHQDRFNFPGIDLVFNLDDNGWHHIALAHSLQFFDVIVATHLVEHLKSLVHFMDHCYEALKPGGVLLIETPNAGINFDLTNCDPTHLHAFRPHSFINYFTPEGIEKFGYTNKPWKIEVETFQLEIPNDCIRVKATPIK